MESARKIAKNTTILFLSQVISFILIFFYTIYIARYLGAEGYGVFTFALAFSGIFSIMTDLGLSTLTVREVARDKKLASKYLGNAFLIKLILSFFTFVIIAIVINMIEYSQEIIYVVYFISMSTILISLNGIFYSIFQAYEKLEYQSLGQIVSSLTMFLGVWVGIFLGFDVVGFSLLFLFSNFIVLVYTIIISAWKFLIPKIEYDNHFWKSILIESLPFGLTGISVVIYTFIDSIMLTIIQGTEVVGWYNAAYKLVLFLLFIPSTINIAVFPAMSKLHISSLDSLRLINEKYFKFMIIIGIPICFGISILADRIILLIFGIEYIPSIFALQILVWTIAFTFARASFVKLLEATDKQIILSKITWITVIVNILLNLALIPNFSFIGASIATVLTEIVLIGMIFKVSFKFGYGINFKLIIHNLIKILLASLIMCLFLIYFKNLNLLFLGVFSTFLYFLVLYFIRGIDDKDLLILKQIFKK